MKFNRIFMLLFPAMLLVPQTASAGILSNLKTTVTNIVNQPISVKAQGQAQLDLTDPSLMLNTDTHVGAGDTLTYDSSSCLQLNSSCPTAPSTDPGNGGGTGGNGTGGNGGNNGGGGSNTGGGSTTGVGSQAAVSTQASPSTGTSFNGDNLAYASGLNVESSAPGSALVAGANNLDPYTYPSAQKSSRLGLIIALVTLGLIGGGVAAKRLYPKLDFDTVLWPDE